MEEKRSKYDTNPLDPDFVRRTEEVSGATREVARTPNEQARRHEDAEAPTRRMDEPLSASYPSVFIPPVYEPPAAPYTTYGNSPSPSTGTPPPGSPLSSRTVPGIGVPERWAATLPYAPFYIGAIFAIIELFVVPRGEVRTRFHAAQGLALHLAILAGGLIFRLASFLVGVTMGGSGLLSLIWWLFGLATVIYPIILMLRQWKGEEQHLAPLTETAKWLNKQFEPRK